MNFNIEEFNKYMSTLITNNTVEQSLFLQFDTCVIKVTSNSVSVIDNLKIYFEGFEANLDKADIEIVAIERSNLVLDIDFIDKPSEPGKTKIKEQYYDVDNRSRIIRKKTTGLCFFTDPNNNLVVGECKLNLNQVINFINNRFMQYILKQKGILLHAAAVQFNGLGIAMSGFSGKGKSTLALFFLNQGADFVSNDRLISWQDKHVTQMLGVVKHPRVNPGTIVNNPKLNGIFSEQAMNRYLSMSNADLWSLEEKYDVPIGEFYGKEKFVLKSKLDVYIILNWDLGSSNTTNIKQINLLNRKDLLSACMKSTGLFYLYDQSNWFNDQFYLNILSSVKVYEVSGRIDFGKVVDFCKHLAS